MPLGHGAQAAVHEISRWSEVVHTCGSGYGDWFNPVLLFHSEIQRSTMGCNYTKKVVQSWLIPS
jgi:hypothetical protein